MADSARNGRHWFDAELLRLKGEALMQSAGDGAIAEAEHCFRAALDTARRQGALAWELRAAISLVRSRADGPGDEARSILLEIRNRFTEGFGTADFRVAGALLDAR